MITNILVLVIFTWLLILTYFVLRILRRYLKITSYSKSENLGDIIDNLLKSFQSTKFGLTKLEKNVAGINKEMQTHFKKIGIVHYSAFKKGLENSTVLAILRNDDSGFIINFIHTHEGVRVYTKKVKGEKNQDNSLSPEEVKAIKIAN